MSYFVGGAIVVSAVAGAASSKNAADKAAKGQKAGMKQSLEITNRAREDVMKLFDQSARSARIGMDQAMNFYKQAATQRMTPFLQGNQAAQNAIGIGAQQAQNAILGLPVDMAAMNQQPQIQQSNQYMLGAQIPNYAPEPEPVVEPSLPVAVQPKSSKSQSTASKLWENDPINVGSMHKKGKKLLKKIF